MLICFQDSVTNKTKLSLEFPPVESIVMGVKNDKDTAQTVTARLPQITQHLGP